MTNYPAPEYEPPNPEDLGGMTSDILILRLRRHRANDVYVEITDAEFGKLGRARVHDVQYDLLKDQIIILAHKVTP